MCVRVVSNPVRDLNKWAQDRGNKASKVTAIRVSDPSDGRNEARRRNASRDEKWKVSRGERRRRRDERDLKPNVINHRLVYTFAKMSRKCEVGNLLPHFYKKFGGNCHKEQHQSLIGEARPGGKHRAQFRCLDEGMRTILGSAGGPRTPSKDPQRCQAEAWDCFDEVSDGEVVDVPTPTSPKVQDVPALTAEQRAIKTYILQQQDEHPDCLAVHRVLVANVPSALTMLMSHIDNTIDVPAEKMELAPWLGSTDTFNGTLPWS
ncbi:hypothetical protein BC832DRAFT_541201 [Gaertneriomyces semiglobifer]|nr:hypothetical protein BC832DRAFT_541201 [Gaertneriomyces semiglobifer]